MAYDRADHHAQYPRGKSKKHAEKLRNRKEIVEKEAVLRYYSRGKSNWRDTIMAAAPQGQVSTAEQLPSSYRSLGLLSSPYTSRIDR